MGLAHPTLPKELDGPYPNRFHHWGVMVSQHRSSAFSTRMLSTQLTITPSGLALHIKDMPRRAASSREALFVRVPRLPYRPVLRGHRPEARNTDRAAGTCRA